MPNAVRRARVTDTATVGGLQWASWLEQDADGAHATGLDAEAIAAMWRDGLLAPQSPLEALLVATNAADEIAGFASTAASPDPDGGPGIAELSDLVVDPAQRRQGHGSRLLAAAADVLGEAGAVELRVWATDGSAILGFLASAGFSADGAVRQLASDAQKTVLQRRVTCTLG